MAYFSNGDASEQRAVSEVGPLRASRWQSRFGGSGVEGLI